MTPTSAPSALATVRIGNGRRAAWLLGLMLALALLCGLSVAIGSRWVSWSDIVGALLGDDSTMGQAAVLLRLPRTALAVMAGAALGLAGAVMQGVTRNPLADPGLMRVNTGAALAVVIGVAWFNMASTGAFVWVAIAGAGGAAALVYAMGSLGRGGATPLKLALAGAATSIALNSFALAVILPRNDIAGGLRSWQVGGVGGASADRILPVLPYLAIGMAICLLSARRLNSLALGDDLAAGLGERVALTRALAALGAILLCGATTAACGPIGFVGLVVPHFCRLLFGSDHRWLLPFSAVGGAALLLFADILGRIIARPAELDVGILTAFIGAPVFVWIVRRHRLREL